MTLIHSTSPTSYSVYHIRDNDHTENHTQPKEKPLRTKRGHRKPDFLANINAEGRNNTTAGFIQGQSSQGGQAMTVSPSNSDAFSHTQGPAPRQLAAATNGTKTGGLASSDPQGKRPRNPFELFVAEQRVAIKGTTLEVDKELAIRWQEMGQEGQTPYFHRFQTGDFGFEGQRADSGAAKAGDEDVEMGEEGDDEEA
jgi:non-histone protein 10